MAIGKMAGERQEELFIAAGAVGASGNAFYAALDRLLRKSSFDEFAEEACREFYAERMGRPGLPPGVYFRMLMVGYLEGLGSERGMAWRCRDSISLRESGLLKEETVGVDSTTLEANAAMRAIVRRDDATEYDAWLERLAKESARWGRRWTRRSGDWRRRARSRRRWWPTRATTRTRP